MKDWSNLLRKLTLIGNVIFVLWITYNDIDEGFKGTTVQKFSYLGLIVLLVLNSILLFRKRNT